MAPIEDAQILFIHITEMNRLASYIKVIKNYSLCYGMGSCNITYSRDGHTKDTKPRRVQRSRQIG